MNNKERRLWILNDEGLYNWFEGWKRGRPRHTVPSMAAFIKANREELDQCIRNVTEGRQPAHYLAFGGR